MKKRLRSSVLVGQPSHLTVGSCSSQSREVKSCGPSGSQDLAFLRSFTPGPLAQLVASRKAACNLRATGRPQEGVNCGSRSALGLLGVTPSLLAIQHRQQKMLICRYFKPSSGPEPPTPPDHDFVFSGGFEDAGFPPSFPWIYAPSGLLSTSSSRCPGRL
jgi:hypothetical protein